MELVTDFCIMMLANVLTSGEMYYFSFSTLKLSYQTLQQCTKGTDYNTVIFKLLNDGVRKMNLSVNQLRTKFERYDFGTSALFKNDKGKFEHIYQLQISL